MKRIMLVVLLVVVLTAVFAGAASAQGIIVEDDNADLSESLMCNPEILPGDPRHEILHTIGETGEYDGTKYMVTKLMLSDEQLELLGYSPNVGNIDEYGYPEVPGYVINSPGCHWPEVYHKWVCDCRWEADNYICTNCRWTFAFIHWPHDCL